MRTLQKAALAFLLTAVLAPCAHAYGAGDVDETIPTFGWNDPEDPDETIPTF